MSSIDRMNLSVSLCGFGLQYCRERKMETLSNFNRVNWFEIVRGCDKQISVAGVDRLLADTGSFFETSLFKLVQTFSVLPAHQLSLIDSETFQHSHDRFDLIKIPNMVRNCVHIRATKRRFSSSIIQWYDNVGFHPWVDLHYFQTRGIAVI